MKRNMKAVLKAFANQNMCVCRMSKKKEVKNEIRAIADNDEEFGNMVFEIGCDALAKAYIDRKV